MNKAPTVDLLQGWPSSRTSALCDLAVREVEALWDSSREGAHGYGEAADLSEPPSLYYTAWSLRLAEAIRVEAHAIDRSVVGEWLAGTIRNPNRLDVSEPGLSIVMRLNLAAEALHSLGVDVPADLQRRVEDLRVGGRYRASPSEPPTWAATYLAVSTLSRSRLPVPAAVVTALERAARHLGETVDVQQLSERLIPVWAALVFAEGGESVARDHPELPSRLAAWSALVRAAGASGVSMGLMRSLSEIASAVGLDVDPFEPAVVRRLATTSGMLAVEPGGARGDPQVTFSAIAAGYPATPRIGLALRIGQMRQGWITTMSPPSLADTFRAAAVNRICGVLPHREALPSLLARSLPPLVTRPVVADGDGDARSLYQWCWLADMYGVAIPASAEEAAAVYLDRVVQERATSDIQRLASALAATLECGADLAGTQREALTAAVATAPIRNTVDAGVLALAARRLRDPTAGRRAVDYLRLVRAGVHFRMTPLSEAPDLLSTMSAYFAATDREPAGAVVVEDFQTPWGPALTTTQDGSADQTVTLLSLAAGVALAAGRSDPALLW